MPRPAKGFLKPPRMRICAVHPLCVLLLAKIIWLSFLRGWWPRAAGVNVGLRAGAARPVPSPVFFLVWWCMCGVCVRCVCVEEERSKIDRSAAQKKIIAGAF